MQPKLPRRLSYDGNVDGLPAFAQHGRAAAPSTPPLAPIPDSAPDAATLLFSPRQPRPPGEDLPRLRPPRRTLSGSQAPATLLNPGLWLPDHQLDTGSKLRAGRPGAPTTALAVAPAALQQQAPGALQGGTPSLASAWAAITPWAPPPGTISGPVAQAAQVGPRSTDIAMPSLLVRDASLPVMRSTTMPLVRDIAMPPLVWDCRVSTADSRTGPGGGPMAQVAGLPRLDAPTPLLAQSSAPAASGQFRGGGTERAVIHHTDTRAPLLSHASAGASLGAWALPAVRCFIPVSSIFSAPAHAHTALTDESAVPGSSTDVSPTAAAAVAAAVAGGVDGVRCLIPVSSLFSPAVASTDADGAGRTKDASSTGGTGGSGSTRGSSPAGLSDDAPAMTAAAAAAALPPDAASRNSPEPHQHPALASGLSGLEDDVLVEEVVEEAVEGDSVQDSIDSVEPITERMSSSKFSYRYPRDPEAATQSSTENGHVKVGSYIEVEGQGETAAGSRDACGHAQPLRPVAFRPSQARTVSC